MSGRTFVKLDHHDCMIRYQATVSRSACASLRVEQVDHVEFQNYIALKEEIVSKAFCELDANQSGDVDEHELLKAMR